MSLSLSPVFVILMAPSPQQRNFSIISSHDIFEPILCARLIPQMVGCVMAPQDIPSESLAHMVMVSYMLKGTLQIIIKLSILTWGDDPG